MRHRGVLAILALLGACSRNPVSGRLELTVMSAAEERRIGAEQAAKVARTIGLVDDPRLGADDAVGDRGVDRHRGDAPEAVVGAHEVEEREAREDEERDLLDGHGGVRRA